MNIDRSKLKANGQLLTQKLFLETNGYDRDAALYTLGDEDKYDGDRIIYSISRLYVDLEDVHEHIFATRYFSSWRHWQKVANSTLLQPYVREWREELYAKLQSRNLKRMEELAGEGEKVAIKYMADKGWTSGVTPKKRGRPSKEEKQGYLKQEAAESSRLDDDYMRIIGDGLQ